MKVAFIKGTWSSLGHGLAECLSHQGWKVYGCSRRGCGLPDVHDRICDLTDYDSLPAAMNVPLADVAALDLVILNGGILGEIGNLTDTPLEDLKQVMEGRRNPAR